MAYEDSLKRQALQVSARRSRQPGEVRDPNHPIRPMRDGGPLARENGLFVDQTGENLIGWGTIAQMTT